MAEERAKKAMIDAARLADELRIEQENAQYCEKTRKSLDYQVKDMQSKLDEAEQLAMKGGRKITSRYVKDFFTSKKVLKLTLYSSLDLSRRLKTWRVNSMMSSEGLWMPKRLSVELSVELKNLLSLKMKITRTMSGCKNWLINFRTR